MLRGGSSCVGRDARQRMTHGSRRATWHAYDQTCSSRCPTHPLTRRSRVLPTPGGLVAYDPRRHQGMTLRHRWSRHLRASSPLHRRRRRIPSFTTPSETLFSPRACARRAIFPVFSFTMTLFSPHVFKRAFACLSLSL